MTHRHAPIADLAAARILVTNDDGIAAPGIRVLEKIARTLSRDVWVVAPETQQSAVSHALTVRRPLRAHRLAARRYAVEGTPTDCVLVAVHDILGRRPPDLVLSGINMGANLGEDIGYSGTVAAAMEATLLGRRAIALSLDLPERNNGAASRRPRWDTCERVLPDIIRRLAARPWPDETLVNVNVPDRSVDTLTGVRVAHQGRRKQGLALEKRTDPDGRPYYWLVDWSKEEVQPRGSDLSAINEGAIAITPITIDFTARGFLGDLRAAFG
ncbi:5'/3'-nucleotidase SurE [Elioraea sp. Yellowstone]|jgi:5'-nucleotidase|uniref:5'/3'-nucleotidase SurE n=1 Tax=Elioraea sp. Yellowstone TaxID=2592070 RepID=UPI0011515718|nr:5'/3'-nucleotidase SurE [Elioraea sp. Yellowstone]TQF77063.1 5'/3'-nucleotidase SurE [Elioraea sp. Yellowstone]